MKGLFIILSFSLCLNANQSASRLSTILPEVDTPIFHSMSWTRDPFFPSRDRYVLNGLITNQMAYINGKWVSKDEKIDEYTLAEINTDKVVLRNGDELFVLRLEKGSPP